MAHFNLFLTKLLLKFVRFWSQIQQNRLEIQSHCVMDTTSWFNKWAKYENLLAHYENSFVSNYYHKATTSISTVLFKLCPMTWRNVMGLIQKQQAKSFQIRYNLS